LGEKEEKVVFGVLPGDLEFGDLEFAVAGAMVKP
jgi:hypothetical protein